MKSMNEAARAAVCMAPLLLVAACSASSQGGGAAPNAKTAQGSSPTQGVVATPATTPPAPSTAQERVEKLRSELETTLLAGPSLTDALGYRSVWQTRIDLDVRAKLVGGSFGKDSMLAWDSAGIVSRLRPLNGNVMWQAAPSSPVERILTAAIVPVGDREFGAILTDTRCFIVDAGNGHFEMRQDFKRLANTPAVLQPPYLVYGTRDGQVVWHDYIVGYDHRTGQLDGQVVMAPRLVDSRIVATSTGGSVAAFSAGNARLIWERHLNGPITARAEASSEAIWVPCHDQYFWCLSMKDGRTLWRYFTQSTLEASPVLLQGSIYLQLPGEGLVSFEPMPQDKLDGVVKWRSPETVGSAFGLCRAGLLVWDEPTRTLTVVEEKTGSVVKSIKTPTVRSIQMIDPVDGDLMLLGDDGRVQRITPVVRRDPTKP